MAGGADVQSLETELGAQLPAPLRGLYGQRHDGQSASLACMSLMPPRDVIVIHRELSARMDMHGTCLFFSDGDADHAGVYVGGPLRGKAHFFFHEEPDLSPRYRSVDSFVMTMRRSGRDWSEMDTDYPAIQPPSSEESRADRELAGQMQASFEKETDPLERVHYAYCAMVLTPPEDTASLVPYLRDDDMWIQARACAILGMRKYEPAVDELAEVALHGGHNGSMAALRALGCIRTRRAMQHLHACRRELSPRVQTYVDWAIQGDHGNRFGGIG